MWLVRCNSILAFCVWSRRATASEYVLRCLNLERTKVIDYVEFDKDQVAKCVKTDLDENARGNCRHCGPQTLVSARCRCACSSLYHLFLELSSWAKRVAVQERSSNLQLDHHGMPSA
jgi:hypothetical protein